MTKKSDGPTVAEKIRKYAAENPAAGAADIAKAVGTKVQYVHTVWYLDRKSKKSAVKRKVGRPRKVRSFKDLLAKPSNIASNLVPTAQEIRMQQLENQIDDLKTVVRYLEGKLYGAPV